MWQLISVYSIHCDVISITPTLLHKNRKTIIVLILIHLWNKFFSHTKIYAHEFGFGGSTPIKWRWWWAGMVTFTSDMWHCYLSCQTFIGHQQWHNWQIYLSKPKYSPLLWKLKIQSIAWVFVEDLSSLCYNKVGT